MVGRAQLWLQVNHVAGASAYRAGWPRSWNPHQAGTEARKAWRRGWLGAEKVARPDHVLTNPAAAVDVSRAA